MKHCEVTENGDVRVWQDEGDPYELLGEIARALKEGALTIRPTDDIVPIPADVPEAGMCRRWEGSMPGFDMPVDVFICLLRVPIAGTMAFGETAMGQAIKPVDQEKLGDEGLAEAGRDDTLAPPGKGSEDKAP